MSNSSVRVCAKCSHSALLICTPLSASNVFSSGTHEPHPVPAFVHAFTPATSVSPSALIESQIAPLLTAWQEQTCAESGNAPDAAPSPSGEISVSGSPAISVPTSGRSSANLDASPTRMPPSSVLASSETTSLA